MINGLRFFCFSLGVHWSVILSVFGFIGSISTFILAIFIDGKLMTKNIFPETALEWTALVGVGFTSFIVQITFTQALKYQMAAIVSLERKAADVIFAFLYQVIIFKVRVILLAIEFRCSRKYFLRQRLFFSICNFRKCLLLTVPEEQH